MKLVSLKNRFHEKSTTGRLDKLATNKPNLSSDTMMIITQCFKKAKRMSTSKVNQWRTRTLLVSNNGKTDYSHFI